MVLPKLPKARSFSFVVRARRIVPIQLGRSIKSAFTMPTLTGSKETRSVVVTVQSRFYSWAKRKALSLGKQQLRIKEGWYGHTISD